MSRETATVIRRILPNLQENTLRELRALIAQSLAIPLPSELQDQPLGLLIQMVACTQARIPLAEEYETERVQRAVDGEEWPSRLQLDETYGSWLGAVSAAAKPGGPRRCAQSPSRDEACPAADSRCTRRDALLAIARCKSEIGSWPTQSDYLRWRGIVRHASGLQGLNEPRLPDARQLRRLYGSWPRARAEAQRRVDR
ncbi:MAG TPA: hypothetical protein VNV42_16270 [Solirubrobacteraceae bacterium]|jgi:hypothetical protein|nr:hypothetical protein [Solirubrobacteraceae bacterium]